MNGPYQLPPILTGTAEQQLVQLRDYLVRLARELPTETQIEQATKRAAAGAKNAAPDAVQTAMTQAQNLKSLIVKTAKEVEAAIDTKIEALDQSYVAKSDFGVYTESVATTITQTAKETVEAYRFQSKIDAANASVGALASALTKIKGEICRGFVPDPERAGEYVFGIAVAADIKLKAGSTRVNDDDKLVYEEVDLDQMKALGLYTATGWQFWINGRKAGWFDADDGMLHVPQTVVEDRLKLGADWLVTASGGFGIRYVGV